MSHPYIYIYIIYGTDHRLGGIAVINDKLHIATIWKRGVLVTISILIVSVKTLMKFKFDLSAYYLIIVKYYEVLRYIITIKTK